MEWSKVTRKKPIGGIFDFYIRNAYRIDPFYPLFYFTYDSLRTRVIRGPIKVSKKVDKMTLKGVIKGAGTAHKGRDTAIRTP